MRLAFLSSLLFLGLCDYAHAQYRNEISVQVNPLLQQILPFGSPPPLQNPYLVRYRRYSANTPYFYSFGFGMNYRQTEFDSGLKTTDFGLDFRVGYFYEIPSASRFHLSAGMDLIVSSENLSTHSISSNQGVSDSTIIVTTDGSLGFGGGARLNLSFDITERLSLGSEVSLYFLQFKNQFKVEEQNWRNNGFGDVIYTSREDKTENTSREFTFTLPVAVYLAYRF